MRNHNANLTSSFTQEHKRMKALIYLATGFEEIEAVASIDILRRADISVQTVSLTDNLLVKGAYGTEVKADRTFDEVGYEQADILILPGGLPGSHNLSAHAGLTEKIRAHHEAGKWLAAICAAPLVYGRMGLLKGKTVVCYPGFESELEGATIADGAVSVSGQFITGKGPGLTMDFALEIVKQLKGHEVAKQVADGLLKSTSEN